MREAIDLERMRVQMEETGEASLQTLQVRGKTVSQNKEAIRKRQARRRYKQRAATSDDPAHAAQVGSSDDESWKRTLLSKLLQPTTMTLLKCHLTTWTSQKGRKKKEKFTRAAVPSWGVATSGGSQKWQPSERAVCCH